jgi:hypothetical protein
MSRSKRDLVDAAAVLFAEYVGDEHCNNLRSSDNPEQALIFKDSMDHLSSEAKLIMKVIMRLPAEMFDAGRIVNKKFLKFMKLRYNWSAKQVMYRMDEIRSVYE